MVPVAIVERTLHVRDVDRRRAGRHRVVLRDIGNKLISARQDPRFQICDVSLRSIGAVVVSNSIWVLLKSPEAPVVVDTYALATSRWCVIFPGLDSVCFTNRALE